MATLCPVCNKKPGKINRNGVLFCADCNRLEIADLAEGRSLLTPEATDAGSASSLQPITDKVPAQFKSKLFKDEPAFHFSYIGFKGGCGQKSTGNEYIMVTNTRVLYTAQVVQEAGLQKSMATSAGAIPLDKVSFVETVSAQTKDGCSQKNYVQLKVNSGGGSIALAIPSRAEAERAKSVIELLSRGLAEAKNAPSSAPSDSIPDQLKKISDLKDQGILTEEEFLAKKKELLAKM